MLKPENIKYILTMFIGITFTATQAQQLPLFSQYSEYGGLINASDVSYDYFHSGLNTSLGVTYRDQWTALPDRPRTMAVHGSAVVAKNRSVGLVMGGYLLSDKAGVFSTNIFSGRIAALFSPKSYNSNQGLSVGINVGVGQYNAHLQEIQRPDEPDPILPRSTQAVIYPDIGLGMTYYRQMPNKDYLKVGLSIPQIFGINQQYRNEKESFDVERVPHYFFTGSYHYMLTEDTYFQAASWVRYVENTPWSYDLILRYKFSEFLYIGAGANSAGIIHTEIGTYLKMPYSDQVIKASYSFNPTFRTHSVAFGNIHELNISYVFRGNY